MSVNPEDLPQDDDDKFGLSLPTGNMANQESGVRPEIQHSKEIDQAGRRSDEKYKPMGWKGIDDDQPDDDDDEEPQLSFSNKEPIPEDELDMTPMVDVTFLLLIFFMVTASFTLQKSIPHPPAASDAPSTNVIEEEEEQQDYVEVIIDQNNSYYVTTRDSEEREAPSETEMRRMVKDAKDTYAPERIVITAHVDATHARLIAVCDAGQSSGLKIEVKTTDLEF